MAALTTGSKNALAREIVQYIGNEFAMTDEMAETIAKERGVRVPVAIIRDVENRAKHIMGAALIPTELLATNVPKYKKVNEDE
jgi:hypothetical protein